MPLMPTRPILIRVALALALIVAMVMLADGVALHELRQATGETHVVSATTEQPDSAHVDK